MHMLRQLPIVVLAAAGALAQTAPEKLEFEVASVKPAAPYEPGRGWSMARGGPGSNDPTRITYTNLSLHNLLMNAYEMRPYQVLGPVWMTSQNYDVIAKVPEGTTKEQARVMMQNLLIERFKLVLHKEQKETPVFELVVAKNGPKLKEFVPDPNTPGGGRGGMRVSFRSSMHTVEGKGLSMSQLVAAIGQGGRPVIDKTGLTGYYDIHFEYAPDPGAGPVMVNGTPAPPAEPGAPPLANALQQQLGLKLESARARIEYLVIEKADKTPVEN